ncbi:MAG TPA: dihydrofolate reductase family protein [Gemmatimonadales bacterium]
MRRVRFSVAISLDGYIAGPNGENDWIVVDPDIDFGALMGAFDTVLLGRKTYEATREHGGGGMPGMQATVFSRTLREDDCPGVRLSSSPEETVTALRRAPGKDIWLFGGGELLRSMLALRLVDSVEVAVIPVLLGGGIPLLAHPAKQVKLKLAHHRLYPKTGTVSLEYEPA